MKRALLLFAVAACTNPLPAGEGGRRPGEGPSNDLDVAFAIDPDPVVEGDNTLHVTVREHGKPVDGATVSLEASMPAMGAMPEMKTQGTMKADGAGRYRLAFPIAMAGDWSLTLRVEAPGRAPSSTRLKVSTNRRGFTVEGSAAAPAGSIAVSPQQQQLIGVVFAPVEARAMTSHLRAAGIVEVDERKLAEVTLKYEAYAQKLFVGETGKAVRAGDPLLVVYSPDLLSAEEQLVNARHSGAAPEILEAASRRLTQWDLTKEQIATVEREGRPDGRVTIVAPAAGVVLEKNVVEGARLMAGTSLYRIGNLGRVWVQAEFDELDSPKVAVDQPAKVSLPAIASAPVDAKVSFVAPVVDQKTRTLEARLELLNPQLLLKPGMFADVELEAPLGTRLAVPDSALLWSGEHRYAFVDRGNGKLQPVEVHVGVQAGGFTEVKSGLTAGEQVATQATFLLSSEAKLRDALPRWSAP